MIRAVTLFIALTLAALASPLSAQSLPDWQYTSVNDFAKLLNNDDTRVIDQALIALHDETGVEGTVVTLDDRASHGGAGSLEAFATRLFNYWGVGDRRRNDGFMVLVLKDDREARIELGAGYPADYDRLAAQIMDRVIVPAFRNGNYSGGLREGTLAVIEQIARPHAAGLPAQALSLPQPAGRGGATERNSWLSPAVSFGLFGGIFLLIVASRRRRRNAARGLSGNRGYYMDEAGELHRHREPTRASDRPSGRDGGFGGGSSSGGGASGRW